MPLRRLRLDAPGRSGPGDRLQLYALPPLRRAVGLDYVDERIQIRGAPASYVRRGKADPALEILFCPTCAGVLSWRGLRREDDGRIRIAVNVRLAAPEAVAALPVERFDGLDSFEDLPVDGRCVRDLWF